MTGSAYNQGAHNRDFTVIYITSLYLVMKDIDLRLEGGRGQEGFVSPSPFFFYFSSLLGMSTLYCAPTVASA